MAEQTEYISPPPVEKPKTAPIDWPALKEEWMAENLDPKRERNFTLKALALRHSVAEGTVRNKASDGSWRKELKDRAKERAEILAKETKKRGMFNELEVRERLFKLGRGIQSKGLEKLQELTTSDFSAREAIDMLKLGVDIERRAIGLPDEFVHHEVIDSEYEAPMDKLARIEQDRELAVRLAKFIKKRKLGDDLGSDTAE